MSIEQNSSSSNSSWSFLSLITGAVVGGTSLYLVNTLNPSPDTLTDIQQIIEAVPDSLNENEVSDYILSSVEFRARLQGELNSYDKETSISKEVQDLLTGSYNNGSGQPASKAMGLMSSNNCADDTIKGVNFDLLPLINSMMSGQNITDVSKLTLNGYGIYVAFSKYPDSIFSGFPHPEQIFNQDYKSKRTAIIHYTQRLTKVIGTQTQDSFYFLNKNGGSDPNLRLADNLGMVCPRHCPK